MKNIILCGFMGCGKSVVGKMLADSLNLNFYDTDLLIEAEQNMKISDIFKTYGEDYFRRLETKAVRGFENTENNIISLGGGLAANEANHPILKAAGFVILLDCGTEETLNRILGDNSRPLTAGGEQSIIDRYNMRKPIYESLADAKVDSSTEPQKTLKNIISLLEEKGII